ncbi:ion channel [Isoptericola sediminis]|uniref:Potassium channel domain-containing protein n=1 Tax=Isoptericola sediminis TaxID=2733572 RepID=A0A849JTH6_9MICO|nr:hypothetical protein [Isoptericola sediminis]
MTGDVDPGAPHEGFFPRRAQPVAPDDPRFDPHSRWVDRFGVLLALSALTVVLLSLVDLRSAPGGELGPALAGLATTVTVGATFVLALRAAGLRTRPRRWLYVALGLLFVLSLTIVLVLDTPDAVTSVPPLLAIIAAMPPVLVVRRLLYHRVVSLATVLGAVSAYVLIAVAYYYAFITADAVSSTPFFGQEEPSTAFMYFSLTTITTLGYGDLAAESSVGRLLATSEAVIGQVYLVVFVAMIVSLAANRVQHRRR